ncbi:MAG: ParB/RepB/Spo0J family partition protein [Pirellulales bacterium]
MTKERRLGRGLEALLGRPAGALIEDFEPQPEALAQGDKGLVRLSVYEVDPNPYQPRRDFDDSEIISLCESLKEHGLLQPIVVRRAESRYQLVSGERRLRAAIKAGWIDVPALIREADDRQVAELAIVENLQRKDLNPLEKAASFHDYLHRYGCTQDELAGRLKVDRSTIANLIRLLELPDAVQDAIRSGAISQGHGRALLPLGDEQEQIVFCQRIQDEALSVRATEQLVHDTIHQADAEPLAVIGRDGAKAPARRPRTGQVATLEQELRAALGTKVDIRQGSKGRGRLVVHFGSHEEFERLRALLCDTQGAPLGRTGTW